jgi:hypothetical protein
MKTWLIKGVMAPYCHWPNPSLFGLVLASLLGESLGTMKRLVVVLKFDLCV